MKTISFLTVILILSVQLLQAGPLPKDTLEYKFPEDIIITSTRINMQLREVPFSASYIGLETMDKLPRSIAVDEPLKLVPGVKVDNQANGSRIHLSMRGQGILSERGIRGIKILMDGIPVNDPTGFAPDFFDVDFGNVVNIEVLRGPAASLYGGSASGGIVSITTKNAPNVPLFGEAYFLAGSNNFWKGAGRFGGSTPKVNYTVSFSRTAGDGYRDHTHFWGNNVYAKANYKPAEDVTLTPIFGWTDFYHENPEGINLDQYKQDPKLSNPDAIPFNEYLETNRVTNGLTGVISLRENQKIQFNGFVKRTQFTEANNHTFNRRIIVTPGTSLQYTIDHGSDESLLANSFSIGTDLQWQTIDEARTANDHSKEIFDPLLSNETMKTTGLGFFAIDNIKISKKWNVMLSLRYDKIKNELTDNLKNPFDASGNTDFSKTTGRIGVSYTPCSDISIFANWGQGFLPPATEELAQNPDNFGGYNTHLTFSTSNGIDVGLRGKLQSSLYYDVTGFYMTTDNDFDRYRISNPLRNQETFYRNAASSKRYGLELYLAYYPVKNVEIQGAYTYSKFTYTNSTQIQVLMDDASITKYIKDGNMLPNSPEHQLNIDVQYFPIPELNLSLSSETMSKSYIDGANVESEAVEAFTLFNARVAYQWKLCGLNGELSISLRNIGDTKYVAFSEPDPGGNAYQPGAGREMFGGIKIRF